jgi:hypothetical protein
MFLRKTRPNKETFLKKGMSLTAADPNEESKRKATNDDDKEIQSKQQGMQTFHYKILIFVHKHF